MTLHTGHEMGASTAQAATPGNPAVAWIYSGLWGVLTGLLLVPRDPPALLREPGDGEVLTLRPSAKYLTYLKLGWVIVAAVMLLGWLTLTVILLATEPLAAVIVSPLLLLAECVPLLIGFLSLHLRYDTTWYVLSDRSMRLRRGAWLVHETSITYENIQQVAVMQGPLQRFLGISTVVVTTAGGGSGGPPGHGGGGMHIGLIEGLEDAERIRETVLARQRASRSAGLGDEAHEAREDEPAPSGSRRHHFSPRHIEVLREIRALLADRREGGRS